MNVKQIDMTREELAGFLNYDPETGALTWRVDVSRNVKAGSEAGTLKSVRMTNGEKVTYRYIHIRGMSTPAARAAWFLHYGEWPNTNIQFNDGNTLNIRIDNLRLAKFASSKSIKGGRKSYKMTRDAQRHYGLKRYYGLTLAEYSEKLLAQNGVCAICERPERHLVNGKPKPLSVDHCHSTGKIRALLCAHCNHMIGHAEDNREILLAAVAYLDKHKTE